MTYAALEDLVERASETEILQIADRDGNDVADPDVIEAALVHADNIVNGYVAHRYSLPFAQTPDLVRTWATSIARYYLHSDGAPDQVKDDYKDALSALKDVSRGMMSLPDATGQTAQQSQGVHMAIHPDEVFTRQKLAGYND
jgi:phage gp36-like protein